jgi:hypothetical protein
MNQTEWALLMEKFDSIVAEQQETNRLLSELLEKRSKRHFRVLRR